MARTGRPRLSDQNPAPTKLQQLQYRSYKYTMIIYHYRDYLLPLKDFKRLLSRKRHGYRSPLVSPDLLADMPVTPGDEIPPNCIEVAYLPKAFQRGGCALGFRVPSSHKIEWLCFVKPIKELIDSLAVGVEGGNTISVFDYVAELEKGGDGKKGSVKGHKEHRLWHEALKEAEHQVGKCLKLTWKNRAREREEWIKQGKPGMVLSREEVAEWYTETDDEKEGVVFEGVGEKDCWSDYDDEETGIEKSGDGVVHQRNGVDRNGI